MLVFIKSYSIYAFTQKHRFSSYEEYLADLKFDAVCVWIASRLDDFHGTPKKIVGKEPKLFASTSFISLMVLFALFMYAWENWHLIHVHQKSDARKDA